MAQAKLIVNEEYKSTIPRPSRIDYEGLKESFRLKGYMPEYPIITNEKGEILDGYTRFQICQELGIEPKIITKHFEDKFQELEFILLVNRRRNLTEDQRTVLARKWQKIENDKAMSERAQKANEIKYGKVSLEDTVTPKEDSKKDKTRHKASKLFDVPERKLRKLKEIEDSKPEAIQEIENGKKTINEVHRKIKQDKQKEAIKELKPINGTYNLIVVDPPWEFHAEYNEKGNRASGENGYPTMNIEQIKAIKLPMAKDCVIWLWGVDVYLKEALEVLEAWGLERKSTLIWVKDKMGLGTTLRMKHEYCFLAFKGKPTFLGGKETTILEAPRINHSEKPEAFYEMAKRLSPYLIGLDYFARKKREGWDSYGDEIEE